MNRTNNKYLVIKLSGNWIENEQITGRLKYVLRDVPCAEVLENAAVKCYAAKYIAKEQLQAVNDETAYKLAVKKQISDEIGNFLFGQNIIKFIETRDKFTVEIVGSCLVIKEGGADNEQREAD